ENLQRLPLSPPGKSAVSLFLGNPFWAPFYFGKIGFITVYINIHKLASASCVFASVCFNL
ncbi:MAG: hypothetical protein ABFS43_20050, partial [Thermodesulfobacteriota bacterium]